MIHQINQENPQLREMHSENIRLRVSLEDHQRALEHIMTKYREHTQMALKNSKLDLQELFRGETEKNIVRICAHFSAKKKQNEWRRLTNGSNVTIDD